MLNKIKPFIAKIITSTRLLNLKRYWFELKRKIQRKPHLLTVYLRINDAYSYMLLQVLGDIEQKYRIKFNFVPVLTLQEEMYPEKLLWQSNAFKDACYLAKRYKLSPPIQNNNTSQFSDEQITAQLVYWQDQDDFISKALALFHAYWRGEQQALAELLDSTVTNNVYQYLKRLIRNEKRLEEAGHYLAGTIHYGSEWYWGLDRIDHLELRLYELRINRVESPKHSLILNPVKNLQEPNSKLNLDSTNQEPIEMFWSIRSPYSYIALLKAIDLAEKYQCALVIKPVLPMAMRGMAVPKNKRFYIALDAKREAKKYGIDFGFIADPLGKGVERCYALYEYAQSQGKEISFLKSFAEGVWAQGIHSDTDQGLQLIVERCGLNWLEAKKHLYSDDWRSWAQKNLEELYRYKLWGVPSFKYRNITVFGQDRLDCIEYELSENDIYK